MRKSTPMPMPTVLIKSFSCYLLTDSPSFPFPFPFPVPCHHFSGFLSQSSIKTRLTKHFSSRSSQLSHPGQLIPAPFIYPPFIHLPQSSSKFIHSRALLPPNLNLNLNPNLKSNPNPNPNPNPKQDQAQRSNPKPPTALPTQTLSRLPVPPPLLLRQRISPAPIRTARPIPKLLQPLLCRIRHGTTASLSAFAATATATATTPEDLFHVQGGNRAKDLGWVDELLGCEQRAESRRLNPGRGRELGGFGCLGVHGRACCRRHHAVRVVHRAWRVDAVVEGGDVG